MISLKTKFMAGAALAAVATGTFTNVATAEEFDGWLDKDRFQVRARMIGIIADGDGTTDPHGLTTEVSDAVVPEVDLTYFITKNIAAELIAATAQHEVKANDLELGEVWILPPTLTLQYHFQPEEKFSPYVGAGVNYSFFYEQENGAGLDELQVDGGWGYALQAGADYWMNDNWGVNFDVKYIDVDIDANVTSGGTYIEAKDVKLDPWVVGAGISYRF